LAIVAVCFVFVSACRVAAEPFEGEGTDVVGSIPPDAGADPEVATVLAFKPLPPMPLGPADLPPSNPFANRNSSHSGVIAGARNWRADRVEYRAIIERESLAFGLPAALIDAVIAVESSYNPATVGLDGEIGLMQVMPATARMLGFTGTETQLAVPEINIHYGAKYLAGAWRLAREDLCTTTMKYRAGHGETRFSFRSVAYCARVRNHLAAHGVVVTGALPQPTFGAPTFSRFGGRPFARPGAVNFTALNARLRLLTDRIGPRNLR
jgi:hypothetical protein